MLTLILSLFSKAFLFVEGPSTAADLFMVIGGPALACPTPGNMDAPAPGFSFLFIFKLNLAPRAELGSNDSAVK